MPVSLLITLIVLVLIAIALLIVLLKKDQNKGLEALEDLKKIDELKQNLELLEKSQEKIQQAVKEEIAKNREETNSNAKHHREELSGSLNNFSNSLFNQLNQSSKVSTDRLDKMRETVEARLKHLQEDNNLKLEKMRATVDEKLHSTLEKRLGESFKLVSERLELVHKGLGEMQNLASGVGDLKNILSNVKTRGTWGEIQLENLLDQILTSEQYEKNVGVKKNSQERVDFAIKLPGKDPVNNSQVWLPIDSKFPQEDYQRLTDAHDQANVDAASEAAKQLENRLKLEAKSIKEKYIDPPHTTDFAILFLPVEGLYAEIIRRPGLCEKLQRDFRVIIAGPTTLSAILNSLQMGFRTLAIEKRSSEVWSLLSAVKNEFGKFGEILEKTQKKLQEASNTIDTAARKSRTIERKLKNVQELPDGSAEALLLDSN